MQKLLLCGLCIFMMATAQAKNKILRVAAYGGEIPISLIKKFEAKTGIKVNFTNFESNENLLIKLESSHQKLYDVITPSNYYIPRLEHFKMIQALDKRKLKHLNDIDSFFMPSSQAPLFGVPFVWGATIIFYNDRYIQNPPFHWVDFWNTHFKDQLLLIDDTREVFSMAMLSLGLNPNDGDANHIKSAYKALLKLSPNIKLFSSDALTLIITDEDAIVGMAWNGDIFKVRTENKHVQYIYPSEGYVLWEECFAIPANAEHINEAYQFINFMTEAKNSAEMTRVMHFPVTNLKAKQYLPKSLSEDKLLFPSKETLSKGTLQLDPLEENIRLYNSYWELFKISL